MPGESSDSPAVVPHERRRLAAIVFTDVVSYSARMQRDEPGTMALVKADFAVMRELCAKREGEVLNTMGDGMLMCFSSAVEAVSCALELQKAFGLRAETEPPEKALLHRIGIHVGDVFWRDGQVSGDGVNIAARLESKAPHGGICASQIVYETVKGKVEMWSVFLGEQKFKNIAQPIAVYTIAPPGSGLESRPPAPTTSRSKKVVMRWQVIAAAAVFVIGGYLAWRFKPDGSAPSAAVKGGSVPAPVTAKPAAPVFHIPEQPAVAPNSVAVLAFANLSDDKGNEYFSDGISEELLNVLAKIPGLKVVSRTSAFYFKGKDTPIPEIARKLGVAYVVEGSVRKAGDKVRITAQLIKAADDFHVWSDTFTRDMKDIFAVQDEIAGLIAQNLQIKMDNPPRPTRVVNPEAHRLVFEGRYYWNQRNDAGYQRAEQAFNQAIELDPGYAEAYSGLSAMLVVREDDRLISGLAPNPAEVGRSRVLAQRALELDPTMAEPHGSLGLGLRQQGRLEEAQAEFEKALALNPGDVKMHSWYGTQLLLRGRLDEGMSEWEKTLGLDPLYVISLLSYPRALTFLGRWDNALKFYDRVAVLNPGYSIPNSAQRARALWGIGRKEEALAEARSVRSHRELKNRLAGDAVAIYVLREAGFADEAAEYAEESLNRYPANSYLRGFVLTALGRFDEALPFLERTPVTMNQVLFWDAMWDPWRNDPRFGQLMDKLGCAAEYKLARETLARMLPEQGAAK